MYASLNKKKINLVYKMSTNPRPSSSLTELKALIQGNLAACFKAYEHSLIEFIDLGDSPEVFESQKSYETIRLCEIMLSFDIKNMSLLLKHKAHEKFVNLMQHICSVRSEIDFKQARPVLECDNNSAVCYKQTSLNERRIFNLTSLNFIFMRILNRAIEFRRYFTQPNASNNTYLRFMFEFIEDSNFLVDFYKFNSNFDSFTCCLIAISKNADECRSVWQELSAVEKLLRLTKRDLGVNMGVYGIISNIASDQEIERIAEIEQIIDVYADFACRCVSKPDGKLDIQFKNYLNEEQTFDVIYINDENRIARPVTSLLACLYHLSVNEKVKLYIFKKQNLTASLKTLILTGIEVEKQHAIQLLAQLAFNEQVNAELDKELELKDYVQQTAMQTSFEFKNLKKSCQDFLWILKNDKIENIKPVLPSEDHIMISYNTGSRELCLKIKEELERFNFKVWIDVNEIHGSSLESMANAVEKSECVLMCVTEKYRQSLNCQAEAQYAFRLNKCIIPLIMQPGYHSVKGWLGFIIGDKIFVDFSKYSFEDSFKRLVKQIRLNKNIQAPVTSVKDIQIMPESVSENKTNLAQVWTKEQVNDWFKRHEITVLHDNLKPIDGKSLFQLYQLKKDAPEFFFRSLTKNDSIDIKKLAVFNDELIKLFKK